MRISGPRNEPSVESKSTSTTTKPGPSSQVDSAGAAKNPRKGGRVSSTTLESAEKVQLSSQGKEAAKMREQNKVVATEVAKAAPAVREDRVKALKESIQNGTYKVDADAVADRMVDEHLEMPTY